jgi:hypothetical protein
MGLGNTVGTLPGILSPIISGYIVTTPVSHFHKCINDVVTIVRFVLDCRGVANHFLHSERYLFIWLLILWNICFW